MYKKLIIIFCFVGILFLACVPTPDKDYISQKDMTQMIEQAKQTPDLDSIRNENEQPNAAKESPQAEERVQLTFSGNTTDQFRVEVDAAVTRPTVPMPIVRVVKKEIDMETANRYYQVLTEGIDLYNENQLNTAPALDQKIQEAMDEIANGNDEEPMKDYLNQLIEKRKTAPDTIGEPVKKLDLQTASHLYSVNELQEFQITKQSVFFINQEVYADTAMDSRYEDGETQYVLGLAAIPSGYEGISMTPKQAEAEVSAILEKTGLSEFRVTDLFLTRYDECGCVYVALCDRYINGIPVAHPAQSSGSYMGSTTPAWGYEQAIVCINDKGVALFQYRAQLQLEDVLVEDANLLSFDRILEIFQNMMCTHHEVEVVDESYGNQSLTYHITDVTLSLQRISEEGSIEYGLLVPVWNFWGYASVVSREDGSTYDGNHIEGWKGKKPILSINAVTGSVIDPIKGY